MVHPSVSASIRFSRATFDLPGVNATAFCKWASENFGVDVEHVGGSTFEVSAKSTQLSPHDIWGALKDIHAHRDWVRSEGPLELRA
jgi:hypothetical protein